MRVKTRIETIGRRCAVQPLSAYVADKQKTRTLSTFYLRSTIAHGLRLYADVHKTVRTKAVYLSKNLINLHWLKSPS